MNSLEKNECRAALERINQATEKIDQELEQIEMRINIIYGTEEMLRSGVREICRLLERAEGNSKI